MPELGLLPELGLTNYLYSGNVPRDADDFLDATQAAYVLQSCSVQQSEGNHERACHKYLDA
eukprot:7057543-Pyramimonas_sp.AAC.1